MIYRIVSKIYPEAKRHPNQVLELTKDVLDERATLTKWYAMDILPSKVMMIMGGGNIEYLYNDLDNTILSKLQHAFLPNISHT